MQPQSLADPTFTPVTLPQAWQRDFEAQDGSRYRLLISMPEGAAPARGFPSLVLVDGHALFPLAATTARLQAQRPEATGIGPAVVIGIGYPDARPFDAERRQRDLLPVTGGADRFLGMIVDEILPAVAQVAPLDPGRRALAGHSYGGLFVLHVLFTRPGLFEAHVAGSPSIWWQDRAVLASEESFRCGSVAPAGRLLITVGSHEQDPVLSVSPQRAERLARARMRDNAAEMAGRLSASGRVDCSFTEFPGENHVSVIPSMLSRAVAFALAGTAQDKAEAA
ncbi:alpha/beta hydrolase-fold protein [uncultured Bosea sp.]|uniref:alpha/beta hydrolase n=1 Tax=uncultured Bosea sp. TaxID=211457 RepID=UPI0025D498A3|nr:alpha/beta hydrolase-fold protein [uncultured Bosea sp.]